MGNLALHSAEEPDNLRATTATVEVPTKRDNDVALAPGARLSQQHEHAARHNGAQRGATADINGAPVFALNMAQSPDQSPRTRHMLAGRWNRTPFSGRHPLHPSIRP